MEKEELVKIYAEENCIDYKNALQAAFGWEKVRS